MLQIFLYIFKHILNEESSLTLFLSAFKTNAISFAIFAYQQGWKTLKLLYLRTHIMTIRFIFQIY